VARLLLRRLVGPITLWDASEPGAEWVQWEASVTADLLDGLVQLVASPARLTPFRSGPFHMAGSVLRAA
jgi:hypothetical protein